MPESEISIPTEKVQPSSRIRSRTRGNTESLEMILASLEEGDSIGNKLNDEHIHKLLDQRAEVMNKIQQDRKDERWDNKFYVLIGILSSLIILGIIAFFAPEYLSETISALFAGTGGLGIGYGLAKR